MAKRNKSKRSSLVQGVQTLNISTLISKAIDRSSGQYLYANHAQFTVTDKEINLDFYFVGVSPTSEIEASFIQRIVIPHVLGKGFTTGLANAIASFESGQNIILPNQRQPLPDDKITIWT